MEDKPTVFTIFGASGDLANLKLYPSIYNLHHYDLLPRNFKLIGFSRKNFSNGEFRKIFKQSVEENYNGEIDINKLEGLLEKVYYFSGNYDDPEAYKGLREMVLNGYDVKEVKNLNYLSVPPFVFRDIIGNLAETRESRDEDIRLIIEKPFGEDEESANQLYYYTSTRFEASQIYLLDHYLGKLAVQSLLHLRRANRILNSMLQGTEISNIQITAHEQIGVEERVGYFDKVGIIKDFVHSHLLQILALVTMNIPTTKTGQSLSREKYSILSALNYRAKKDDLVVAQYDSYCSHNGVPSDSKAETFAAMRLGIDLEEWYKVPIYIRVGKKLKEKVTYVVVELEKYEFQEQYDVPMNRVIFKLQPDQEILVKIYNQFLDGTMHELDLAGEMLCDTEENRCNQKFSLSEYATLINDAINGKKLFFIDFSEVLASWKIIDEIIKHKNSGEIKVQKYADGSDGPEAGQDLPKLEGFSWHPY